MSTFSGFGKHSIRSSSVEPTSTPYFVTLSSGNSNCSAGFGGVSAYWALGLGRLGP